MIEAQQNGQPGSAIPDHAEIAANWSLDALAEEIATYRARLSEIVTGHEGEFAFVEGTEIVGFFPDESSALREGRGRFGFVPFLVKRITAFERVVTIPNVVR